jgi:S-DNA-T family DNA segregation ATPase FtsK/SpoIIIE
MATEDFDHLVGAIAFGRVRDSFRNRVLEEDFDGAFHVLSGFTPPQLAGFAAALASHEDFAQHVRLQFNVHALAGQGVSDEYLTTKSVVDVRNAPYEEKLIITAEIEKDARASLSEFDRTDVEQIYAEGCIQIWIEQLCQETGVQLTPEAQDHFSAAMRGLFRTPRSNSKYTCAFLYHTLKHYEEEGQIARAAGIALPQLSLPLAQKAFASIPEAKLTHASAWERAIQTHANNSCYLNKRDPRNIVLDTDELRGRLAELKETQNPALPDEVLQAFANYIDAPGARSPQTEDLLFNNDWDFVRHCFERNRTSATADFVQKTRDVLHGDDVVLDDDDKAVLEQLSKQQPKAGNVPEEVAGFFQEHASSIAEDPRLLSQWESLVHGSKVTCSDLYEGIVEAIERSWNKRTRGSHCRLALIGRHQEKPNRFLTKNPEACRFFERSYGQLGKVTSGQLRFEKTLVTTYHLQEEWLKNNSGSKKRPTSKKANTLEFEFVVEEQLASGKWGEVDHLIVEWVFDSGSILAVETGDLHRLAGMVSTAAHTSLIEVQANYEAVGRKGTPFTLSLHQTDGFSDSYGAGGRGSVVPPKKDAANHSVPKLWNDALDQAQQEHQVSTEILVALRKAFSQFREAYDPLLTAFSADALHQAGLAHLSENYVALLLQICLVSHEALRRRLLRLVLTIGNAQVQKTGSRPPLSIICPWHPLRLEAIAARNQQFVQALQCLLQGEPSPFSDVTGKLYFGELRSLLRQALYPEASIVWDGTQPRLRMVSQNVGGYSLHEPTEVEEGASTVTQDDSRAAARQIEALVNDYLRLQPHERDNLSVALYNCDSASLPKTVVEQMNAFNDSRGDDEVTCQIFLMHRNETHLRNVYRELVSEGTGSAESSPTEATGDFLSKVRVNIVAASAIPRSGRSEPVDIAYCKDLISAKAKLGWVRRPRVVESPEKLRSHQWSRRLPIEKGIKQAILQLCCPAQTEAGWAYLFSLSTFLAIDAKDAWEHGKCPVPMKLLDFDTKDIQTIFNDTHQLATWVVNQDEILDRRLLEAQGVKVIRYVQSATQGRNLIISSKAKDTLLLNTLKEKLRGILPAGYPESNVEPLAQKFIHEANQMSGGLVLRAARRAKNTNELLGMVLSRFLIQTEIGLTQPAAWCFLDDYARWLGKKEEAQLSDLLILYPSREDGGRVLNIAVTEAKFIHGDILDDQARRSERQLRDTLGQLEEALMGDTASLDQPVWLSRLSDMLLTRLEFPVGTAAEDLDQWRVEIRNGKCKIRLWGYSHIFVHSPPDLPAGQGKRVQKTKYGIQEVFSPSQVGELILAFDAQDAAKSQNVRDQSVLAEVPKEPRTIAPTQPQTSAAAVPAPTAAASSPPKALTPVSPENSPSSQAKSAPIPQEQLLAPVNASKAGNLAEFLEARSLQFASSQEEGHAWLKATFTRLKSAFLSRQLPFKQAEGFEPILTPNAGIFRLQGSPKLTIPLIESKAQEIFTSEGLQIIAVNAEPTRLRLTISRPHRQTLHTEAVLLEYLKLQDGASSERLLVGIREEDGKPLLLDPFQQPHTLVAGMTGSGKSVLLQNIILSIAATKRPADSRIFLIDPKCVDFLQLQPLPHLEGGIIDSREEAIKTLESAVEEMESRYQLFKKAGAGIGDIRAYRKVTGQHMPTWWIIHDEFADWMQVEEYREAIPQLVNRLSVKARAAGIFLIFAAQRPDNTVFPIQMRDQLGNRLILKVQSTGTSEIALGEEGAERLLENGHMLARIAGAADAVFAQVPFIDPLDGIPALVARIQAMHASGGNP